MKNLISLLLGLFVCSVAEVKLPSNFQKCDYGDLNFNNCLAQAIEFGASLLSQPIPSIGLPNLDPLEINAFSIAAGNGPVGVEEHFQNAKMYGLNHINVQKAEISLKPGDLSANFTCEFSKLEIYAQYHINGKVLLLPIEGRGNATLLLKNLTAVEYFPLETLHKRNKTYLRVTPAGRVTLPNLGLLYVQFENLFNGNKQLGDTLNSVINENWVSIFDDVRSGYEKLFTEIIVSIFNNFFKKVPLTEMMNNVDLTSFN